MATWVGCPDCKERFTDSGLRRHWDQCTCEPPSDLSKLEYLQVGGQIIKNRELTAASDTDCGPRKKARNDQVIMGSNCLSFDPNFQSGGVSLDRPEMAYILPSHDVKDVVEVAEGGEQEPQLMPRYDSEDEDDDVQFEVQYEETAETPDEEGDQNMFIPPENFGPRYLWEERVGPMVNSPNNIKRHAGWRMIPR